MDERIEDLLALYALGGLTEAEQREVDAHLAQHPELEAVLREMKQTATALAHSAPPLAPSPALEEQLMARVEADAAVRFAPPPQQARRTQQAQRPSWLQILRTFFGSPLVAGTGFALAALLLVWGLTLNGRLATSNRQLAGQSGEIAALQSQVESLADDKAALVAEADTLAGTVDTLATENSELRTQLTTLIEERDAAEDMVAVLLDENDDLQDELATLLASNETLVADYTSLEESYTSLVEDYTSANDVLTLFTSPGTRQVLLPGTEAQPAAEGQFLYDPDGDVAVLFVDDMPQLSSGQVYQVLLIRDDGHDTAETFAVNVQGQNALLVHAQSPLHTFTAIGVSVEPEGGSVQRTGDIVLLGELSRS